jgi:hypothetical protein
LRTTASAIQPLGKVSITNVKAFYPGGRPFYLPNNQTLVVLNDPRAITLAVPRSQNRSKSLPASNAPKVPVILRDILESSILGTNREDAEPDYIPEILGRSSPNYI